MGDRILGGTGHIKLHGGCRVNCFCVAGRSKPTKLSIALVGSLVRRSRSGRFGSWSTVSVRPVKDAKDFAREAAEATSMSLGQYGEAQATQSRVGSQSLKR